MKNDVLIENGIVVTSSGGYAEVRIIKSEICEECSAKLFCKPNDELNNLIKVIDPFNCLPGNEVRISIQGSLLLNTTIKLFGMPLIIFLCCLIFCLYVFSGYQFVELVSIGISLFSLGVYYYLLSMYSKKNNKILMPRIISAKKNHS